MQYSNILSLFHLAIFLSMWGGGGWGRAIIDLFTSIELFFFSFWFW